MKMDGCVARRPYSQHVELMCTYRKPFNVSNNIAPESRATLSRYCTLADVKVHSINRSLQLPGDLEVLRGFFTSPRVYNELNTSELWKLIEARGIKTHSRHDHVHLVHILELSDVDRHQYTIWSKPELAAFIKSRGIEGRYRTKSQIMQALEKADQFPIMKLPAELRNMIYKMHLQEETIQLPDRRERMRTDFGKGPLFQDPLLLACRQIRKEALPTFYRTRRFPLVPPRVPTQQQILIVAPNIRRARTWYDQIRDEDIAQIRSFIAAVRTPVDLECHSDATCYWLIDFSPRRDSVTYRFVSNCGCWEETDPSIVAQMSSKPARFHRVFTRMNWNILEHLDKDRRQTWADLERLMTWCKEQY